MVKKVVLLSILMAAFVFSGCGNPFESLANDLEGSSGTGDTTASSEDKVANVSLSFTDNQDNVPEPAVGDGFTASHGEYQILVGQMMSFSAYKGTPEAQEFPQFSGLVFHPEIRSGLVITIAENDDSGTSIFYAYDDETSWYAVSGELEIVTTRPLNIEFRDVLMKPLGNSIGEFTINGPGTWQR